MADRHARMADLAENTSVGMSESQFSGNQFYNQIGHQVHSTTVRELAECLSGRRDQLEYVALLSRNSVIALPCRPAGVLRQRTCRSESGDDVA